VTGLRGEYKDWKVTILGICLEAFHYLESIHAGHLQIEQDQIVAIRAMERTDLARIPR